MRKISGHYTDKHNKAHKFDFQVASTWEELDRGQQATILQVLNLKQADKYTVAASLISLLFGPKNWAVLENLPEDELHALMPLTNFLMETQPALINHYPTLKLRKKVCHAPALDLGNIGFGEWCFAYQSWYTYQKHNEPDYLDKLLAILYRPADAAQDPRSATFSGDIRELFNENLIEDRERAVKDIDEGIKLSVYAWFTAALIKVMDARPLVFPKNHDLGAQLDESADDDGRTWFDVFTDLLGPKWGQINDLKYTNAMFVLNAMESKERDSPQTPAAGPDM